ncbi:branched-chain-amino-acid transaminase [Aeoliella mucimassa]|uniref:Branched-chain-amino-acid aminotransferase n=1 Tax=Aeoliella mucimassa TaxID=2527972 RepID=A0A518ASR0_9BACT|nr:branched-chain-amino-acid transaminase [Aeoliella mucimassa]QDU57727.1 Branched-chain-amino-acid aminotransferase [Aeoliella mucimassa]
MAKLIYISGDYFPPEDAKISVFDHGLLYGDGVFEGLRIYSGKVFRLDDHIQRLYESAKAIVLDIPLTPAEMAQAINETVAKNGLDDGYVRAIVTRGSGTLGLDPNRCSNPEIIIIASTITLYPQEYYDNGLEIVTVSTIRNHPAALSPRIKSLNYLNNILAKIEGLQAGCIEALMLNHKGEVAECTGDNVFIVKDGKLLTPPLDAGILAGVTRQAVIELALDLNFPFAEQVLTKHDVYVADECFLTGSAAEIVPVVTVDTRSIGTGKPGPVTKQLTDAFHKMVRS